MNRKIFLISNDPTFVFMMTTIVDHLDLPLQSSKHAEILWNQIAQKKPSIVMWDFDGAQSKESIEQRFRNQLPESSHLFVFSNGIEDLSHLKNARLHLFAKPFSPSEISHLIRNLVS